MVRPENPNAVNSEPKESHRPIGFEFIRNLSLRFRVLVAIIAVWLILSIALYWILLSFVKPSYVQLESRFALNDLNRIQGAFSSDLESLGNLAKDYSNWDEMYEFVRKPNAEFVASDLHESLLGTLKVDLLFIYDDREHAVFSKALNPKTGTVHRFIETDPEQLKNRCPILVKTDSPSSIEAHRRSGTFRLTDGRLIELSASPVVKSDGSGPLVGTVVFGRIISDYVISEMRQRTKIDFDIISKSPVGEESTDLRPHIRPDRTLTVSTIWKDPTDTPIGRIKFTRAASVVEQGENTLAIASFGTLAVSSVVMLILLAVLQLSVVGPLGRLSQSVDNIQLSGNLGERLSSERKDEIGLLASSFDKLLVILGERAAKLEYLATIDELTEIFNRRAIMNQLHQEIERATRYELNLAILLIDIDYFKRINDTDGHAMGDRVLRNVALVIKSNLRETDYVGRYGGEEFLVVMPHQTREGAETVAERLRGAVENGDGHGATMPVTISIGVAFWDHYTREALLFIADKNLYAAKCAGRNRVVAKDVPSEKLPKPSLAAMRARSKRPRDV